MPLPTNISESTRRLNPQIFGPFDPVPRDPVMRDATKNAHKRIRQRQGDGMNKWEREYLSALDLQWSHIYREVSLPLCNGVRYKLDFLVVSTARVGGIVVEGHEVKGRARAAGIIKVKMAAKEYPWIAFRLVTKRKKSAGDGWEIEPVLP